MIIVSQHLRNIEDFQINPDDRIVWRVNLAWVNSIKDAKKILQELGNEDVYLDYPHGRTKPPKPTITIKDAVGLANAYNNVKYFAISNAEKPEEILLRKGQLRKGIEVVPKIETFLGVDCLEEIIEKTGIKYIMLDKDDLYLDLGKDSQDFELSVEAIRERTNRLNIKLLELQGVIFA